VIGAAEPGSDDPVGEPPVEPAGTPVGPGVAVDGLAVGDGVPREPAGGAGAIVDAGVTVGRAVGAGVGRGVAVGGVAVGRGVGVGVGRGVGAGVGRGVEVPLTLKLRPTVGN
jgi:hypothetical protein